MKLCILALISLTFSAGSSFAASFDCDLPNLTPTEATICEDDTLSLLDDYLSLEFANKKKFAVHLNRKHPEALENLYIGQGEWLAVRDECGAKKACIKLAYFEQLESSDLEYLKSKSIHLRELPDDQILSSYDYLWVTQHNQQPTFYEALLRSSTNGQVHSFAQGDFAYGTQQWLDIYKNGVFADTYASGEDGFPFSMISLAMPAPYSVELTAEAGDMVLRGNRVYRFDLDYDGNLQIISETYYSVSRPGIGDVIRAHWDYQTSTYSHTVSVISADCEIIGLPQIFAYEPAGLIPEISFETTWIPDYSYETLKTVSNDPSVDQNLRYAKAFSLAADEPKIALEYLTELQSEGYPLPRGTMECMDQFVEHFDQF